MRSSLCLPILLMLAITACLDPSPAPPAAPTTAETSQALESCTDSCDCEYGAFCLNRVCVGDFGPFAPCYCAARDCQPGQVCNIAGSAGGGFCESSCTDSCDCDYGSVCSGGQCQVDFGPWAPCYCGARDCAVAGQTCSAGFCASPGGGGGIHPQQ
jgi:hypothetical protein